MESLAFSPFKIILLFIHFVCFANSSPSPAQVTLGPQGYASFASLPSFSVLKPCAQGCLKYNGVYVCGMAGYGDLGSKIGCGCSPQNYCFCDKREASAVTSYIQSCVNTKCGTPTEESAVLDLYNGYCLTANIAVDTTSTKPYSFTGSVPTDSSTPINKLSTSPTLVAAGATPTNTNPAGNNDSSGGTPKKSGPLGIGAIVGIAISGVVIIGAALCIGCCMFWKKRSSKSKAKKAAAAAAYTAHQPPLETAYVPPPEITAQIDGTGVFGVKRKPTATEQVKPYTVSPMHTPPQTAAVLAQGTSHEVQGNQLSPQRTPLGTPSPGYHEIYTNTNLNGGGQQPANVTHHEMYTNPNNYNQNGNTSNPNFQPNNQGMITPPIPNHHEIYTHSPHPRPQELYAHANQDGSTNGGYGLVTQRQQQGNWIAAQVPPDHSNSNSTQSYQQQQQQQQQSPIQLPAGQDGVRTDDGYGNGMGYQQREAYEKP